MYCASGTCSASQGSASAGWPAPGAAGLRASGDLPQNPGSHRPGNPELMVLVENPRAEESETSGAPLCHWQDRSLVCPSPFSQVASEKNAASGAVGSSAQSRRRPWGGGSARHLLIRTPLWLRRPHQDPQKTVAGVSSGWLFVQSKPRTLLVAAPVSAHLSLPLPSALGRRSPWGPHFLSMRSLKPEKIQQA